MVDSNRYNALMYVVKEDHSYHQKCMKRQKELRELWFKTMDGKSKGRPKSKQGSKKKKGKSNKSKSPNKRGARKKKKESKNDEESAVSEKNGPPKFETTQTIPKHKKVLKLLISKKGECKPQR